jgi:hypothetical protein
MEDPGLLADKGDVQKILEAIRGINDPMEPPEDPVLLGIWRRMNIIEAATKKATGIGLSDIPIDAETVAAITGLAVGTIRNYGSYKHFDTIRIGVNCSSV